MQEKPGFENVSIVIPAYNEAETIGLVVAKLAAFAPEAELIVVDDGSSDDTGHIAEQEGARVIRHPYNKGNGAAVKTGLRGATREVVVLLDGDGQHECEDISHLLSYIPEYDLVIGARDRASNSTVGRAAGNHTLNSVASYLVGTAIPDLTSGFRAVKRSMIMEFIRLLPNGFSYPTTSTLCFLKAGYSVKFVPIKTRRRSGGSKIKLFRDGTRFSLIIMKIITLYSPLRLFLPVSLLMFLLGAAYAVYTIATQVHVTNSSVLLLTTSVIVFLIGLVSEQIAAMRFEGKEH